MTTTSQSAAPEVYVEHGLAGRIPILYRNRIFINYREYLLTSATLGSASYAYLVGASLAALGTTWIGIAGYLIGLVIGVAFVALSAGVISYRYGIDAVDASKPCLGTRGSVLMLVGATLACLGWANVLLAMTARGLATFLPSSLPSLAAHSEVAVTLIGATLIALIWILLRRGAKSMERAASYCAMIQMAVAVIVLALIFGRFGLAGAVLRNVAPEGAVTGDRLLQLAYAVEFGMTNGMAMVAFIGGLSRLVKRKRHVVGPVVIGYPLAGCTLVAAAGALAAVATGQQELRTMFDGVVGPVFGPWLMAVVMATNLGTMVAQIYIAGVSMQQVSQFANWRWQRVVAAALAPSLVVIFHTQWLLDHVMAFLAYGGLMFIGLSAMMLVDYFVLRKQQVAAAHLFAMPGQGRYWFHGGVNWVAILIIALTCWMYTQLFDPVTLRASGPFKWIGASIPTLLFGAIAYYVLMKRWVIRRGVGGYRDGERHPAPVEVCL